MTTIPGDGWRAVFWDSVGDILVVVPVVCFAEREGEFLPFVPNNFDCYARKLVFASIMHGFVGLAQPGSDVHADWTGWERAARAMRETSTPGGLP